MAGDIVLLSHDNSAECTFCHAHCVRPVCAPRWGYAHTRSPDVRKPAPPLAGAQSCAVNFLQCRETPSDSSLLAEQCPLPPRSCSRSGRPSQCLSTWPLGGDSERSKWSSSGSLASLCDLSAFWFALQNARSINNIQHRRSRICCRVLTHILTPSLLNHKKLLKTIHGNAFRVTFVS